MTRRTSARSLSLLGLLALTACVVNLSFEMKKTIPVKTDPAAPNTIAQNVLVDLGTYREVTEHKNQIKSLDLDYAEATIVTVNSGNTATKVTGSLKLRKSLTDATHDIKVGDLTAFPIQVGQTKRLAGTPELDAFLLQQLQTEGKFYAVVDGTVDGVADIVLNVDLHSSIGYEAGVF